MRLLKTSTLTVTRDDGAGYYDTSGRWVESTTSTFDIQCSIQPFKQGATQIVLPEGKTENDARVIFTKTNLKTVNQLQGKTKADTVVISGDVYEAFMDENWDLYNLRADHSRTIFIRQDQTTAGNL